MSDYPTADAIEGLHTPHPVPVLSRVTPPPSSVPAGVSCRVEHDRMAVAICVFSFDTPVALMKAYIFEVCARVLRAAQLCDGSTPHVEPDFPADLARSRTAAIRITAADNARARWACQLLAAATR